MLNWQTAYRWLTIAAQPFVHMLLDWRERHGKEDPERLHERFGYHSAIRPAGKLVWVHAASVGEVMSTLLLLQKLSAALPQTHFLVTTGTVTSARIVDDRLPPRAIHQFVPVDLPSAVERFVTYWQPDMALWVESELWPNLLAALRSQNIPCALLNARLSAKSQRHWHYAKSWIAQMLGGFDLCLAQTVAGQEALRELGAPDVRYVGNLKFAALPLPEDNFGRAKLLKAVNNRPCWLFASSHPQEEEIALAAHEKIRADFPNLLTIIVPRHPVRGGKIMSLLSRRNISAAQRSIGQEPDAHCAVYLADTLGELGLFYRLCQVVVVGGSYVPVGGHNPVEPALLGAAIGFGPLMANFSEVAEEMLAQNAAEQLPDAQAIAAFVARMLRDSAAREKLAQNARNYAEGQGAVHDRVIAALQPLIVRAGLT